MRGEPSTAADKDINEDGPERDTERWRDYEDGIQVLPIDYFLMKILY